jgi:hypothetical protein
MPDIAETITQVTGRFLGDQFEKAKTQLLALKLSGSHRRFLVSRMGSTGSTWLAKLLNSHPDVFCSHEGVIGRIYPSRSYGNEEILSFIKLMAEDLMHGAYFAAGDVGSVWLRHLTLLPKGTFTTALLLRHPAKVLSTRLRVFPSDRSFTEISEERMKCIESIWNIDASGLEDVDRVFLQDAFIFAGQIRWLNAVDVVIQIERMSGCGYAGGVLRALTGQQYDLGLLERFAGNRINQRTNPDGSVQSAIAGFSRRQRAWYETMLGEVLPRFGYSLYE